MALKALHSVIAIEKSVKTRTYAELTALYKKAHETAPYDGHKKSYAPLNDEDETFPDEQTRVQVRATDVLEQIAGLRTEYFDIVATKDNGNRSAVADVVVDGTTLLSAIPPTFLLHLEKELADVRTVVEKMPTLPEDKEWDRDPNSGLYRSPEQRTHRTRKMPRVVVKYEATKEHPAQTELLSEDKIVGYWTNRAFSGRLPGPVKASILSRIDHLLAAVRVARSEANATLIEPQSVGQRIFDYLFAPARG